MTPKETAVKLVFLDFDGVLSPIRYGWSEDRTCRDILPPEGCVKFAPECVLNINRICDATGAVIVVSSSWRNYIQDINVMRMMLKEQGVEAHVIGSTPIAHESWHDQSRGAEILSFMSDYDVESFVILDDADMGFDGLWDQWVQTEYDEGLSEQDANEAIEILGDESNEGRDGSLFRNHKQGK